MNVRRLLFSRRDTDPSPYEIAMIDAGRDDTRWVGRWLRREVERRRKAAA